MVRVTASKASLLAACGAWAKDGAQWADRESSDASNEGVALHGLMEKAIKGEPVTVPDDLAARWAKIAEWIAANRKPTWQAEVAYAWTPATDTARALPSGDHRDYSAAPDALCGTIDIVDVPMATVLDLKTGFEIGGAWAQLRTLGMMVARAHGLDSVRLVVVHATDQGVQTREVVMDAFDIDLVASELATRLRDVAMSEPTPGAWCGRCPHRVHCSATDATLAEVVPAESLARFRMELVPSSPEHAAWMWPRLSIAEEWIESAKATIKDMARTEPIDLGDGTELRETSTTRKSVSAKKLEDLARRLGANDAQIEACASSATFPQIRALKRKGKAA